MAREFGGDAERMREHSRRALERILGVGTSQWTLMEKAILENFALVLPELGDLPTWTQEEKDALLRVIRSKAKRDEMLYLHLTQQHDRLRSALLRLRRSQ
jgi:hypothetical protein